MTAAPTGNETVAIRPSQGLSEKISVRFRRRRCWNPVSEDGLSDVADHLRLDTAGTLLDVGCGTGLVTCDWVEQHGLRGVGIDIAEEFVRRARGEASRRRLDDRVSFETGDGRTLLPQRGDEPFQTFDRAVALGVAGGLGGFVATARLLARLTVPGGLFAVGDQLAGVSSQLGRLDPRQCRLAAVVRSSPRDWDAYYADQWQAVLDWARSEPDHPEADARLAALREHQNRYLAGECPDLDWGVFVFHTM